ncbi:bestrophin family protein [Spirosoma areae]
MILKRNFNPLLVLKYNAEAILIALTVSGAVYALHAMEAIDLALPFSIAAIMGSALAIFIAFRNNTAYTRWWEARTVWGGIINNSRIFARQLIANADNAIATGKASPEKVAGFKQEMVLRQIAFSHALRLHLRRQTTYDEFRHLLSVAEFERVTRAGNVPNMLLHQQGIRIKEAMRDEILGAFDNISMEPNLASFSNWQGSCERIKNTPLLRQYHYFTKLFLYAFMLILPFCLIADLTKMGVAYMLVPVCVVVSFVFAVIGRVGEVNEDPFENQITDVPLTALCNTIERDLKEQLGETTLPTKLEPVDGYLF